VKGLAELFDKEHIAIRVKARTAKSIAVASNASSCPRSGS
jgi:hypothetical protein